MTLQVQAETLHDDTKASVLAEWFADTWLLVVENDYEMWTELVSSAKGKTVSELSDILRDEYEEVVEQTVDFVEEKNAFGGFLREFLQGWGSMPFDIIARRTLDRLKKDSGL